jgi:4-hydroxy-tetrahydrodipicolinate reductase
MAIRVLVSGSGKMGREVLSAVCRDPDLEAVGVVDLYAGEDYISLPDGSGLAPFGTEPTALITRTRPDVIVDFTNSDWTPRLAREAIAAKVKLVIGTSGLGEPFLRELEGECKKAGVGAVVASNFAIGAIVMQHLAGIAARYFPTAEIIELHHDRKVDAPSGTAIATAQLMAEAREQPFTVPPTQTENIPGTRGGTQDGVTIHSVRLPGLVAHQEVIFGGSGETLTIRHDTFSRESFMPGVVLAVHTVMGLDEMVLGLDRVIGLK